MELELKNMLDEFISNAIDSVTFTRKEILECAQYLEAHAKGYEMCLLGTLPVGNAVALNGG